MKKQYPNHPNTVCDICQKPCYKKPSVLANCKSGKIFCSRECFGKHCSKPMPCPVCGKEILAGKSRVTCSKRCSNINRAGIVYRQKGTHTKSTVTKLAQLRERLIEYVGCRKCQDCGYDKIPEIIQIHHIVERANGGTDDLDNLKFLCPNCHYEEHFRRRTKVE